jgi:hypothetical protein
MQIMLPLPLTAGRDRMGRPVLIKRFRWRVFSIF